MLTSSNHGSSLGLEQHNKIKFGSLTFKYDNSHSNLKNLCIQHVPFWNNLNHECIKVEPMLNGITNQVYRLSLTIPDNTYAIKSVCVKKTSTYNSLVFDNDLQYNVAKLLGDNNFGPKIIGRFGDFTIQEWVEGDTLTNDSLQNLSVLTGIAASLAKFHKRVTELVPKEWDRTPMFLTKISVWSQHVERIIKKHNLDFDYTELKHNYELFKRILSNHLNTSNSIANSVLFCHNVLYNTNVLETQHEVCFIDFDFAGFNYVGWEIANLFVKLCVVYNDDSPPYTNEFDSNVLTNEIKSFFVSVYLSQLLGRNVLASDDVVKEFLQSLEIHTLGVNLFWTYWGIVMNDKPKNELSRPVKLYVHGFFEYNLFKSNLKKLNDDEIVNYQI
ncbi:Choline/ethanolamine kinase family protein [Theileria parva strain Muguga]|uniref:Choline kinase, putative n=1 Tax=Theileria parva TaxID=5875 RepID=Q4N4I1_THEPA|nr:Choline/ethanolamine kinase family protein [Theileria parva strain Muguga]EAN32942.1 Choline/ethanolamine kinase family protein [Theileria parva strain Muguga]|eukprot:XP_765225.1 choline kinase [Theileria parva strain Muguga]